ncbi:PEPxxWA-CTERM sorting domain-containing protein [Sandarakinorhabdus sp.]|uniref:PEPxxWA-CTERM sorting domain-containing protein n=1 Tax=Sandarakinorhabdus sp. TaxID=1916663 RepID=UPI0033409F89
MMLAVIVAAGLSAMPAGATTLYTFGDSLVDAGNVFVGTGGVIPAAAQGYFQGRFTNGLNYVDYLDQRFAGANTAPSLAGGRNYAFGGARAIGSAFGGFQVPGLPQQLALYFAGTGGLADPNGLYVINFGGNDLFALASGDTGGLTPPQVISLLIGNTVSAVQSLSASGAGKILVTGIPGGGAGGAAIDGALQSALTAIEPTLSAKLYRFSYNAFFTRFAANPTAYGFGGGVDYATSCTAARPVVNGNINCSGFFSFDGTHFTAQVQRGIARDVIQVLGIPEPASWAMLIAGFGLVGAAMRRTRQPRAAAQSL